MLKCFQTHIFTAALFRGTWIPQLKTRSKFNGNLYRNASLPVTNQFYGFKFKCLLLYLRQSHCLISTDSWNEGYFPNFPYSCWNNVITFASWRVPLCMYWQNAPIPRCEWSRAFLNTVSYAQGELSVFKAICYLISGQPEEFVRMVHRVYRLGYERPWRFSLYVGSPRFKPMFI